MNPNANGTTLVGKSIISRAGEEIGRVREVRGGYFQVESALKLGLLAQHGVYRPRTTRRRLDQPAIDTIYEHRLAAPGLEPSLVPDSGRANDLLISDDEALAQREHMERQLAMQRRWPTQLSR